MKLETRFIPKEILESAEALLPEARRHLRDVAQGKCLGGEWTGWFSFPKRRGLALNQEIKAHRDGFDEFYDLVVVIGIGGSYLGTRAVADAFANPFALGQPIDLPQGGRLPIVYAGQHLAETQLIELLEFLDGREPIINVISKSGTTTEPSVAFRLVRQYMERRYGSDANRRIIATTDQAKGALRQLAEQKGYKTFVVPDDIGGRYSVLSAVGLVPLAFAGYDTQALLEGASEVFDELGKLSDASTHAALTYACLRKAAFDAGKVTEVLAYGEPKLFHFVEWWKQLFGESEGKDGKGLFPASLMCTTDLHSLGQFVQDGPRNLFETFLQFGEPLPTGPTDIERRLRVPTDSSGANDGLDYLEGRSIAEINDAALTATAIAHADGGVPVVQLHIPTLDLKSIGAMFAFFESACAVNCLLQGVNPFDQPGVEAYKKNLFALLGKPGFEDLGKTLRQRLR